MYKSKKIFLLNLCRKRDCVLKVTSLSKGGLLTQNENIKIEKFVSYWYVSTAVKDGVTLLMF